MEASSVTMAVYIDANGYDRINRPVEIPVNFTEYAAKCGIKGRFSSSTIQIREVDCKGRTLADNIPFQFDRADDYCPESNAAGTLTFIMEGRTAGNETRIYHISFGFNRQGGAYAFPSRVCYKSIYSHGAPSLRIRNNSGVMVFDMTGGGFSEMRDPDGGDWIGFDNTEPPVCYRGIPNIQVYSKLPEGGSRYKGIFHPGYGNVNCRIIAAGPLKLGILCESHADGHWSQIVDIFPDYIRFTVTGTNGSGFAFLYEGTPGGNGFDEKYDYMKLSNNEKLYMRKPEIEAVKIWEKGIPDEWCYFGDDLIPDRVLMFATGSSGCQEALYQVFDALTVFGFGRDSERGVDRVPAIFITGFIESTRHDTIREIVHSAVKVLNIETRIL